MKVDPRFKDTEFVIEADSYTMQSLWEKFSTEAMFKNPETNRYRWEQDCRGVMETVGHVKTGLVEKMPVCVSFFWYKIEGHLVVFFDATSQVVDHRMVDEWLKKYCNPQYDKGTRRAHCDASNFHHFLHYIRDCQAEELLNKAKKEKDPSEAFMLLGRLTREHPYRLEEEADKLVKKIKGDKGVSMLNAIREQVKKR